MFNLQSSIAKLRCAQGDGRGYFLKCKNRPNAPVKGIRAGLSIVAEQVETVVAAPTHAEPITGRELATGPIPSRIFIETPRHSK